jgi:hypothetical protein
MKKAEVSVRLALVRARSFTVASSGNAENGSNAIFQQIEAISLTERVIVALKNAFFSGTLKRFNCWYCCRSYCFCAGCFRRPSRLSLP